MIKSGQSWAGLFTTHDSTGALATPSVGPVGTLYIDGVSNAAAVTITGSNPYTFSAILPTLTAGQRVEMYITATIAGIATSCVIASEQADTSLVSEVGSKVDTVDNLVDDLENRLSAARAGYLDKLNVSGVLAHSDAAGTYKADVSGMATSSHLQEVEDKLDIVDGIVDSILVDTGTTLDGKINVIDDLVDDLETRLTATRAGYLDRLDAAISSRMATFTYSAPPSAADIATAVWGATTRTLSSFGSLIADVWGYATRTLSAFGFTVATNSDSNVTAIKAKTDNLPALPAAVGSAMTLTSGERTAIANEVESQIINEADAERVLTAITDKIASVNPSLDDLTLAGIASAVRTELGTELARIDAAISSRLSSVGYTSPANADVAAIKAKTDNLPNDPADQSILAALIGALSAAPSEMDIVNALKSSVFDGVLTFEDSIKLYNAILFGKLDGGGSGTLKFRDPADTKDRVTATVDLSTGDRDDITLDLT